MKGRTVVRTSTAVSVVVGLTIGRLIAAYFGWGTLDSVTLASLATFNGVFYLIWIARWIHPEDQRQTEHTFEVVIDGDTAEFRRQMERLADEIRRWGR